MLNLKFVVICALSVQIWFSVHAVGDDDANTSATLHRGQQGLVKTKILKQQDQKIINSAQFAGSTIKVNFKEILKKRKFYTTVHNLDKNVTNLSLSDFDNGMFVHI